MKLRRGLIPKTTPQDAFRNVDNYKFFALNAFYNSHCGTTFGIPAVINTEEA
jgi:hypothetical protein